MRPRLAALLPHLATSTLRATLQALDVASDAMAPLRNAIVLELCVRELEASDVPETLRERMARKIVDAENADDERLRGMS